MECGNIGNKKDMKNNGYDTYFGFLRFALGIDDGKKLTDGDALSGFDWMSFYDFARKQTLVGVLFHGVRQLPKTVAPPFALLVKWLGESESIRKRNLMLDAASVRVYRNVTALGYRCCILKGQGNARLYPVPAVRTAGNIDVWVDATRDEIRLLAARLAADGGKVGEETINHIVLRFGNIDVEMHSTPALVSNPWRNRRLQRWAHDNAKAQCANIVDLPGDAGSISAPTATFNAVYQLLHLYHHFFFEGIGLRQIVDYYYVIVGLRPDTDFDAMRLTLHRLGIYKFAGAVMWVLQQVLGLDAQRMIVPVDERRGRLLIDEILSGGNFGQYDTRYGFGHGFWGHNIQRIVRDARMARFYPGEALCEPMFRVYNFVWRKLLAGRV